MKRLNLTHTASQKTRVERMTIWMDNYSTLGALVSLVFLLCSIDDFRTEFKSLSARLIKLWRHSKKPFLVKYLKVCYLIVVGVVAENRYIPQKGDPIVSTDRFGLPAILPRNLREMMIQPDRSQVDWHIVQAVLSVFSLYRVLRVRGKLKLETITDPFTGTSESVNPTKVTSALQSLLGTKHLPKFYPR